MTLNVFIAVSLMVIVAIAYFVDRVKGEKEESVSNTLIFSGTTLIVATSGIETFDTVTDLIFQLLSLKPSENEGGYLFWVIVGFLLIVLGILLKLNLKERVYVLNMYGIAVQNDIDTPKALKELKLSEHKVKEQIVDFVQFFNNSAEINKKTNQYICKQIESAAEKFIARTKEKKVTYFTGMAPIPYTVYAGTFLNEGKITHYFEYNGNDGHYYALQKATKKAIKKGWDKFSITIPKNKDINASEVVLAISVSHKITNTDLSQFSIDIINLTLSNPKDNVVIYLQQLQEYKNMIYDVVQNQLPDEYPNLNTIHIVASIPSCLSLELGKIIGLKTNRIVDVVVHHYIRSNTPCYTFGLYVNGKNKGELQRN